MEKTTVYLTTDLKRALERAAHSSGKSEAEIIREGIALAINREASVKPRLPLFRSDDPDLAANFDELLKGFGET